MIETKVTGKNYRICTDAANDKWDRVSFWTDASDVELSDGTTVQTKITNLTNEMISLGESVADGKASVASAITTKGVITASDASFATMAINIGNISTKAEGANELIYLGYMKQTSSKTFSATSIENYGSLNTDNLVLNITGGITGTGTSSSGWHSVNTNTLTVTVTKSYNASTGIFTVTAKAQARTNSGLENTQGLPLEIYVKY